MLDSHTGEMLALADYPTFDANKPGKAPKERPRQPGAAATSTSPGSVEKVLTTSSLLDAGKVTPRTRFTVPAELPVLDRVIGDWFPHGTHPPDHGRRASHVLQHRHRAGRDAVRARAAATTTCDTFGLGHAHRRRRARRVAAACCRTRDSWNTLTRAQVAFGQGLSVNALQMATAVNTVANGGELITPSLVKGRATTDAGQRGRHRHRHEAPRGQRRRPPGRPPR